MGSLEGKKKKKVSSFINSSDTTFYDYVDIPFGQLYNKAPGTILNPWAGQFSNEHTIFPKEPT